MATERTKSGKKRTVYIILKTVWVGAWLWTIIAIIIPLSFFIFFNSIILFISCENDPCLTYAALKRVTLCHVHFLLPSCALFENRWNDAMHCNAKRQIDANTHTHVTHSLAHRGRERERQELCELRAIDLSSHLFARQMKCVRILGTK